MHELNADLILATDDGINFWDDALWAADMEVPLLIVNHATSEKPGMQAMAEYLREEFPGIRVEYVDVEFELLSEVVDREAGKSRRRRQKGRERILRVTTNTPTPR